MQDSVHMPHRGGYYHVECLPFDCCLDANDWFKFIANVLLNVLINNKA